MLRVLHVIPSVSPVRGGPSHAVLGIVRKLNSLGLNCEIATTDDDGSNTLGVPLEALTQFQGCPIRFFHRWNAPIAPLREFAFSWPLRTWLDENMAEYDLIHVHALFSYPSTIAMCIARRNRIPYVVRPLGLLCEWSLQQKPLKKRFYLNLIERRNLNGASLLEYSATEEEREASPLKLKPPSVIFPLGFELQAKVPDARRRLRAKYNMPENIFIIVFLSRLHPKKGIDLLLRALALVKDRPFGFVIAGSGQKSYEEGIDRLVSSLGLDEKVHRVGFVDGEEKAVTLQGADVFALTSHSESFGIAVAEAMAAELPVLITAGVPLAQAVVEHDLGWVVDLEEQAITEAVESALADPVAAKNKGVRGSEYARNHYSWDAFAPQLIEMYQALTA